MRTALYAAALLLVAAAEPAFFATVLANTAAALLESTPFVAAGALLAAAPARWSAGLLPFAGCGCSGGASARSLPAAAATWLVFGPLVAAGRFAAALIVARLTKTRAACAHAESLLGSLAALAPFCVVAAAIGPLLPILEHAHPPPPAAFIAGALLAFAMAPCPLGAVGIAAAARAALAPAALGFLCIAGIFDARALLRPRHPGAAHDGPAYLLCAAACALVAAHAGSGMLNPKIALALWPCAAAFLGLAVRHRLETRPVLRIAPLLMIAGAVIAAPLPQYHATETTLADAFPGERVNFSGTLVRTAGAVTLVRYAITCCRADASPVVLRLDGAPRSASGWMRAQGTLVARPDGLYLDVAHLRNIAAPADPFVYR